MIMNPCTHIYAASTVCNYAASIVPITVALKQTWSKMILNKTKLKIYIFLILIWPLNNSFFFFFEKPTVLKNLKIWGCVILKVL